MNATGSLFEGFLDNLNNTCPETHQCNVSQQMVDFLNLTSSFPAYFAAYCLNPPPDDTCPFGYCSNLDIAGPLVRISAYITNVCLCLLIFYSPDEAENAFWSQILTVYSLLITCSVSIFQQNLTRFHAVVANVIVASPLTIYLSFYALYSMWRPNHRLHLVMGAGKLLQRLVTMIAFGFWVFLLVYILIPSHLSRFAQESCDANSKLSVDLFWLPLILFVPKKGEYLLWLIPWLFLIIPIIFWFVAVLKQRKKLWKKGEAYKPRFYKVWKHIGEQYPFIHFTTLVLTPTAYWITIIEFGTRRTPDETFSLSYGQVLACFVTLPALISVAQLYRKCWNWFTNLTWVRLITGRKRQYPGRASDRGIPVSLVSEGNEEDAWHHLDYTEYERPPTDKGNDGQYSELNPSHDL